MKHLPDSSVKTVHQDLLSSALNGKGSLLINDVYVEAARKIIDGAQTSVSLMIFLGTGSQSIDGVVAPETLISALEVAAQRVNVQVILDQDDEGPTLSKCNHQPAFSQSTVDSRYPGQTG